MAINTETRRRSLFASGLAFLVVLPVPDMLINEPDRRHFMGLYGGVFAAVSTKNLHILSSGPVEPNHVPDSADYLLLSGALEAQNGAYIGGAANRIILSSTGDLSFNGTAGFYPRFLTQADEPAAGTGATQCDTGELVIWKDSDNNKIYYCFNDSGTVKIVELV